MNEHTPGPWDRIENLIYALTDNPNPRKGMPEKINRFSCHVYNDNHCATTEEIDANARLIAAAPDLLHALKMCAKVVANLEIDQLAASYFGPEHLRFVREAIEKAEGRAEIRK